MIEKVLRKPKMIKGVLRKAENDRMDLTTKWDGHAFGDLEFMSLIRQYLDVCER